MACRFLACVAGWIVKIDIDLQKTGRETECVQLILQHKAIGDFDKKSSSGLLRAESIL